MKSLESNQVEQLLQILQKKHGQRIVHFCESPNIFIENLHQFCQTYDNAYYLYCTKDECYDTSLLHYTDQSHIKIFKFMLRRPRYLMQGIEYDYLISTLDFSSEDKEIFLEKCYPIIRTGGNIIIIIPNSSYAERDEWWDILEKQYYVSVSIIDDMFDEYDVIVAKRMHGWGN